MFFNLFHFDDINYYDKFYDKSANLLYLTRTQMQSFLHFSLKYEKLHPLLFSTEYATMLLKRNKDDDVKRAHDILHTVISFQDTNKQHETFGRVATYSEDPITHSSPQLFDLPNNAMFCIDFLQILDYFTPLLSKELINKLKRTCYNITFQFSNVYHNSGLPISHANILSSCMFFKCGVLFNNADFSNRASSLLTTLYTGILHNGGFWEHNAIQEIYLNSELLSIMKETVNDPNDINLIDALYDLLWQNLAENYHMGMKILSGPRSDESRKISSDFFYGFITTALGETPKNLPEPCLPVLSRCPQQYRFHFQNTNPSNFVQKLVSRGSTCTNFYNSKIATNFIRPNYTLGSFSCCEFWSWHTPLAGYFRSPSSPEIYSYGVKVLVNGSDFASCKLNSVQHNGCVLGHISFLTNRGYLHPNLTPINGKIVTDDFRIRFYIKGNPKKLRIINNGNSVTVHCGDTVISYCISYIEIAGFPVTFDLTVEKNRVYFDAIIVKSEEKQEINLCRLERAICQFTLQALSSGEQKVMSEYTEKDEHLIGTLLTEGYELKLKTLYKPGHFEYANSNDCQYINNALFAQYTDFNSAQSSQYKFTIFSKQNNSSVLFETDDNISEELQKISEVSLNNMHTYINSILDKLLSYHYTLSIFKQYSVQIVRALFNDAIEKNYQFESIINNSYFDIYPKISNAPSHDIVCGIILDTAAGLVNNRRLLEHQSKKKNIISDVMAVIEKNYQNPNLSLETVSETLGVSQSYISRAFKKKTNTTYVKHLIKVRMEKAKTLLAENTSPEETAPLCGYINVPSFKRAFKQYTGLTVTAWINQNKLT